MEFNSATVGVGDGDVVDKAVGAPIEASHPSVVFGFPCNAQCPLGGAWVFKGRIGKTAPSTFVEVHRGSKEIDALNGHTIRIFDAHRKRLDLDSKVQIVRILSAWRFVMQTVVGIVEPPFAVSVDEFALPFEEVSVVLGFPTNAVSIVSKRSIG